MKKHITSLALFLAASLPCFAAAGVAGSRLPAAVIAQDAAGIFTVLSVGVILAFDYTRASRRRRTSGSTGDRARNVRDESHRLAA